MNKSAPKKYPHSDPGNGRLQVTEQEQLPTMSPAAGCPGVGGAISVTAGSVSTAAMAQSRKVCFAGKQSTFLSLMIVSSDQEFITANAVIARGDSPRRTLVDAIAPVTFAAIS